MSATFEEDVTNQIQKEPLKYIRVLSYNIVTIRDQESIQMLTALVDSERPHVIMLQQVDSRILDKLTRNMLRIGYKRKRSDAATKRAVPEVIFTNLPIVPWEDNLYTKFAPVSDSKYGIGVSMTNISLIRDHTISDPESVLTMATIKLDDGNSCRSLRPKLVKNIGRIFDRSINPVIFGIDTCQSSFDPDVVHPDVLWYDGQSSSEFYDSWDCAETEDEWSIDGCRNLLVGRSIQSRPDQVWFLNRPDKKTLDVVEFRYIGRDSPISPHYGCLVTYSIE